MVTNNKIEKLKACEAKLEQEIARSRKRRNTNIIIGIIVIIIILGYFTVMSNMVKRALEPTDIALMISEKGISYLPELRKELESAAREEIPLFVDGSIDTLINESIPEIRTDLEREVLSSLNMALREAQDMFSTEIDRLLKEHGEELRTIAKELTTDEGTKSLENALYESCVEALNTPEIQSELFDSRVALARIDGALYYLSEDRESFTEREKTIKELLAILRELLNRSQE